MVKQLYNNSNFPMRIYFMKYSKQQSTSSIMMAWISILMMAVLLSIFVARAFGATRTASTLKQLTDALLVSRPGDTVSVVGTIDATGRTLTVPGGVTLYGGRTEKLLGALIYSRSFTEVSAGLPMLQTGGPNVTISSIRLRGATGEITDFDYRRGVSKGIHANHPGIFVTNCEIFWFDMWGVYLKVPADSKVTDCYIHHCRNAGYGYGVWVGGSGVKYEGVSVVQGNLFDACRSAVDGSGHYSRMLVVGNVFLPQQHYTVISRHGQSNGCKGGIQTSVENNIIAANQMSFTVPYASSDSGYYTIVGNRVRQIGNGRVSSVACLGDIILKDTVLQRTADVSTGIIAGNVDYELPPLNIISSKDTVRVGELVKLSATGPADKFYWRFAEGPVDQGQRVAKNVTYSFKNPGVYRITCVGTLDEKIAPLNFPSPVPSIGYKNIVVLPDSGTWVQAWVKDSYIGSDTGLFKKRVLVNEVVVWEDDAAGYEGWQRVSFRSDTIKTLSLELRSVTGCSPDQILEFFSWWDGISVVTPTRVRFYEGFEDRVLWTLRNDELGAGVSTQTPVGELREGERSWLFRFASGGIRAALPGWGGRLTYKVSN